MQLILIMVTSQLDDALVASTNIYIYIFASNGKSVMCCILAYAVVKVYGICLFHRNKSHILIVSYNVMYFSFAMNKI